MITLISGNHPRHKFFVNKIAEISEIENWVIENYVSAIPFVRQGAKIVWGDININTRVIDIEDIKKN